MNFKNSSDLIQASKPINDNFLDSSLRKTFNKYKQILENPYYTEVKSSLLIESKSKFYNIIFHPYFGNWSFITKELKPELLAQIINWVNNIQRFIEFMSEAAPAYREQALNNTEYLIDLLNNNQSISDTKKY